LAQLVGNTRRLPLCRRHGAAWDTLSRDHTRARDGRAAPSALLRQEAVLGLALTADNRMTHRRPVSRV
jgi:hypothetical protein